MDQLHLQVMTNGQEKERERILGIHSGALGDVVLFARLLGEMGGQVTLVAGGEKADLLAGLGAVDRGVNFDAMPMHEVFSSAPPEHCRLGELLGRHDKLVSCFATGSAPAAARLAELCGAADTAMLPVRPSADFGGHLLDLWRDMLGLAGRGPCAGAAWLVPPTWRRAARETLSTLAVDAGAPVVVIHPGAGGERKCWPLERFIELARLVEGSGAARAVFVLGPVECERWPAGRLAAIGDEFALVRTPSLKRLAGILATAAVFLGNDSGPSHLAAALGRPTVALFGPTRAKHFSPLLPLSPPSPCGTAVVTISRDSLSMIQVQDVFDTIKDSANLSA